MQDRSSFRERLLDAESVTPALRERYEREVHMLLEKKLTAPWKWGIIALTICALAQAAFFVYATLIFKGLPVLAKIGFGVGVLFSLAFAVLFVNVLMRGSYNIRTHANAMTGITWVFLVIMITLFMLLAGSVSDPAKGLSMVLNGLVFLIFGVVFLLSNTIQQTHLRTQEKLLEIELRIAELAEGLAKK
jgi:hypothetical protein